jgi:lipoic acid synthetase
VQLKTVNKSDIGQKQQIDAANMRERLPAWMRKRIPPAGMKSFVQSGIDANRLHTVCKEARCPNRAECFSRGTATFLIMGDSCTRSCRFCAIGKGKPTELDVNEPERISAAVIKLKLSYVVITSVTRDDLADGGAGHFAATIRAVKQSSPELRVEALIPDFRGDINALHSVLESGPDVLNHNTETINRLYPRIRPQADYRQSLELLKRTASYSPAIITKSGLMVGLGESDEEIIETFRDLRDNGCNCVTIGQYLQPSQEQVCVERFVSPEQFERLHYIGLELGFKAVFAGPFVRSSYMAEDIFKKRL